MNQLKDGERHGYWEEFHEDGSLYSKGNYIDGIPQNIKSIVLTGKSGGKIANMGDSVIKVPSDDTQRIQEAHLLIEHILCESVESALMGSNEQIY